MTGPDDEPLDVKALRDDDEYVENLRAGGPAPDDDPLSQAFTAWRNDVRPEDAEGPR